MNPMEYTPEAMAKLTPAEKEAKEKDLYKKVGNQVASFTALKVGIAIAIWIAVKKFSKKPGTK